MSGCAYLCMYIKQLLTSWTYILLDFLRSFITGSSPVYNHTHIPPNNNLLIQNAALKQLSFISLSLYQICAQVSAGLPIIVPFIIVSTMFSDKPGYSYGSLPNISLHPSLFNKVLGKLFPMAIITSFRRMRQRGLSRCRNRSVERSPATWEPDYIDSPVFIIRNIFPNSTSDL